MKRNNRLVILLITLFVSICYFAIPRILFGVARWSILRETNISDFSAIPQKIKTPDIDPLYANALQKFSFPELTIYLPQDYQFFKQSKKESIIFKEFKDFEAVSVLIILHNSFRIYSEYKKDAKTKYAKIGVFNDYDYFLKVYSATPERVAQWVDLMLISEKKLLFSSSRDKKIFTYRVKDKKVIVVYGKHRGDLYEGSIFNKEGKAILDFTLHTRDEAFNLKKLTAIISKIEIGI